MTIVSIRCSECDEVKREEHIELKSDGAVCDDCSADERVKEMEEAVESDNSEQSGVSKEEVAKDESDSSDSADSPNESPENDGDAEGDKKPVEESFTEQDPLEW